MSENLTCPDHGWVAAGLTQAEADAQGIKHGCPQHNQAIRERPDVSEMTPEERVEELRYYYDNPMWSGMNITFRRIDALVGRPVYTHEHAWPDYLYHEVLTGQVPSLEGVIAKLPHDMPVVVLGEDPPDA